MQAFFTYFLGEKFFAQFTSPCFLKVNIISSDDVSSLVIINYKPLAT